MLPARAIAIKLRASKFCLKPKIKKVIKAIKENKSKVDILIVSWHADLEFANGPSIPRYDSCHKLIEAGANAVICQVFMPDSAVFVPQPPVLAHIQVVVKAPLG